MKQWQVAQAHCPPQSPSMPGTPWSVAARISVVPAGTVTSWRSPAKVMKVTRGMVRRERTRKPRASRAACTPHEPSPAPLEVLHLALVLLRSGERIEGAEVAALAGLGVESCGSTAGTGRWRACGSWDAPGEGCVLQSDRVAPPPSVGQRRIQSNPPCVTADRSQVRAQAVAHRAAAPGGAARDHAEAFAAGVQASMHDLTYVVWGIKPRDVEWARRFCEDDARSVAAGEDLVFHVFAQADGGWVGRIDVHTIAFAHARGEIGYVGDSRRAGQGLMREAASGGDPVLLRPRLSAHRGHERRAQHARAALRRDLGHAARRHHAPARARPARIACATRRCTPSSTKVRRASPSAAATG